MELNFEKLIEKSFEAQNCAYAPYSNFYVGASLLTKSGKIYLGGNIENASYSATICAERVAMCKAISESDRDFVAICITCKNKTQAFPCGICRQFMREFAPNIKIIIATSLDEYNVYTLDEMLPHSFGPESLN